MFAIWRSPSPRLLPALPTRPACEGRRRNLTGPESISAPSESPGQSPSERVHGVNRRESRAEREVTRKSPGNAAVACEDTDGRCHRGSELSTVSPKCKAHPRIRPCRHGRTRDHVARCRSASLPELPGVRGSFTTGRPGRPRRGNSEGNTCLLTTRHTLARFPVAGAVVDCPAQRWPASSPCR